MSTLNDSASAEAAKNAAVRLGPTTEAPQTGSVSMQFPAAGQWAPGNYVSITASASFHLAFGTSTVTATTSSAGPFPAGVHDFAVPDACTHLAVIAASGSVTVTAWRS